MKPIYRPHFMQKQHLRKLRSSRGFALVIALSLMILLTVLSVGLLSLSSISLRSSSQAEAMSTARANARMALMLALGQLQKGAGPDQRVTAPADIKVAGAQRATGITGAWKSWRPPTTGGSYDAAKQGQFLGYLMSNPQPQNPDPTHVPSGSSSRTLVGQGSIGSDQNLEVQAPVIPVTDSQSTTVGGMAWVTLDEGAKGRVDLLPDEEAKGIGATVTQVGSPGRNRFDEVKDADFLAAKDDQLRVSLPKLVSFDEADIAGSNKAGLSKYFHDFSVSSASVQSNVATGGLKTDLSVLFDNTLPTEYAGRRLYSGTTSPFTGSASAPDPLWSLYAAYSQLYRRTTAGDNAKDGIKSVIPTRYRLTSANDRTLGGLVYEPSMATITEPMLMPTIVRVDTIFSLVTRPAHKGWASRAWAKTYPYMVHLMYLPVVTLHNPYNVPLKFTEMEVEFAQIPIGFQISVNGRPATTGGLIPLNQLYVSAAGTKTFKLSLSGSLTGTADVTMGPGETRIFGTPFPASWNFAQEVDGSADGSKMFDWGNNMTSGSRVVPGMITGPRDGVGYDVDWLAATNRAQWLRDRKGEDDGVICVNASDTISVNYGPVVPAMPSGSSNKFSVTMRFKVSGRSTDVGVTQVFYKDLTRLTDVLKEGTSPRFPDTRSFPEAYPKTPGEATVSATSILEVNSTAVKDYKKARPFAVFSLGAKTTRESFTKSRPMTDTGMSMLMANCDFTTSSSQGSSPLEFILTPVRGGRAAMESSDIVKAFFFGGHGSTNGTTSATIYEIPIAPLQSIAQLRHANAGSLGTAPYVTYTVGESRAHPALPPDVVSLANGNRMALDHSWLANDQLWDGYWFSTLATLQGPGYTGSDAASQETLSSDFFSGKRQLPNPRNMPYLAGGTGADSTAEDAIAAGGRKSAGHILTKGGFNVNSTSVAAWVSVLSSLSDVSVPLAGGTLEKTDGSVPILRTRRPALSAQTGTAKDRLWNSYRTLEPKEIEELAQKIVAEVKLRGPFLSMSEFVNRRLESSSDFSQKGAVQAAIDKTQINKVMEGNADPIQPSDVANYGWKNAQAVDDTTGAGAPGEITQGDVLSVIGSFVNVRSDTFRIRSYGEALDTKGNVTARAWCEAVVQRLPDYLNPQDTPDKVSSDTGKLADDNLNFGRRIEIIGFRWMHPEEV